jgi:hypothetical protein
MSKRKSLGNKQSKHNKKEKPAQNQTKLVRSDGDSSSDSSEEEESCLAFYESLSSVPSYRHWSESKKSKSEEQGFTRVVASSLQEDLTTTIKELDLLEFFCGAGDGYPDLEGLKEALTEVSKKNFMLLQNWIDRKIYCGKIILNRLEGISKAIQAMIDLNYQKSIANPGALLESFERQLEEPIVIKGRRQVQEYSVVEVLGFIRFLLEIDSLQIDRINNISKARENIPGVKSNFFSSWSEREIAKLDNVRNVIEKIIIPDIKKVGSTFFITEHARTESEEAFYDTEHLFATVNDNGAEVPVLEGGAVGCFFEVSAEL